MKNTIFIGLALLCISTAVSAQTTITRSVIASSDDAEQSSNGNVDLSADKLELGKDKTVGLQFTNILVPIGATITSATLEFVSEKDENKNLSSVLISGEANSNPSIFSESSNDLSNRIKTNNNTSWQLNNWVKNVTYSSPDISTIVQELIDDASWVEGKTLSLIIEPTGNETRIAYSVDKGNSSAPKLIISYTGGLTQDIQTHLANDLDLDPTNEYNTLANLTGTDFNITDGGGTLTVDLSSLEDSAEAAAAQATADQAVLDAGQAQATADQAIIDAGQAQSTADNAQLSANAAQATANQAVSDASQAQSSADNAQVSADAAQSAANQAQSDINNHIANDGDTDDTNELNTDFELNGSSLEITDAGGTKSVDLSVFENQAEVDPEVGLNEINKGPVWNGSELVAGTISMVNTTASSPSASAIGEQTQATDLGAFASGFRSIASARNTFASGADVEATANGAVALGRESVASGRSSLAVGFRTEASGDDAVAMGDQTKARSYGEIAMGVFNTDYSAAGTQFGQWDPNDRLFVVGNGTDVNNPSDAMVILKSGNTGINTGADVNSPFSLGANGVDWMLFKDMYDIPKWDISAYTGGDFVLSETNVAARLAVRSGGRIGMGTLEPQASLHLYGDGDFGAGTRIVFGDDYFDNNNSVINYVGEFGWNTLTDSDQLDVHGGEGIHLSVGRRLAGGFNPYETAMYISGNANNRNVGIGTTNPQAKLDVSEDILVHGVTVGKGNGSLNSENTAIGVNALENNDSGQYNTATGYEAMKANTIGRENTANGHNALWMNTEGSQNTALGMGALRQNRTASSNTGVGYTALGEVTIGGNNTAVGSAAMVDMYEGFDNVAVGAGSLIGLNNGSRNTAIGSLTGHLNQGDANVFIGHRAGYFETGDNKLYIDNSDTPDPLIYGDFDTNQLKINGAVEVVNALTVGGFLPGESAQFMEGWDIYTNSGGFYLSESGVQPRLTIRDGGLIGINNDNPSESLDVIGKVKIDDGTQGTGKVLTSDANGVASWEYPLDEVNDADNDPFNELNSGAQLNANTLEISDGGGTLTVDLSSLEDSAEAAVAQSAADAAQFTADQALFEAGLAQMTADNANTLANQALLDVAGAQFAADQAQADIDQHIANDADMDSNNELQNLSLEGNVISISNGNYIEIPGLSNLINNANLSIQQRLDNGESPAEIYQSDNALLQELYGKEYQGGVIVQFNPATGNGLVARPEIVSGGAWGCFGTSLLGAGNTSVGSGLQNTLDINDGCADPNIVAKLSLNYSHDGYDDWFLPSKDELELCLQALRDIGFSPKFNTFLWTSSEVGSTNAWRVSIPGWNYVDPVGEYNPMNTWSFSGNNKQSGHNIIPVRAFSDNSSLFAAHLSDDEDLSAENELNTELVVNGTVLELTDAGGTLTADLSAIQDGVDDADADPANEYNTGFSLDGNSLSITDGGNTLSVDLSSISNGGPEDDPQVGNNTTNYFSIWNGSSLVEGSLYSSGSPTNPTGSAIGTGNRGYGTNAFAGGYNSLANGQNALAFGHTARAIGQEAVALGHNTLADGIFATALGLDTRARGYATTATGQGVVSSNTGELYNGGNIRATGGIYGSDIRYKKDVKALTDALDKIIRLEGVSYKLKADEFMQFEAEADKTQIGFIAQDMQKVLPELVSGDGSEENYLGIKYANLTAVLVEAVKEQQVQIEDQSEVIVSLENEIDKRDERITKLETMLTLLSDKVDGIINGETTSHSATLNNESPWIEQNAPNPFYNDTSIKYFVPLSSGQAQIVFYDINGRIIQSVDITEKGRGELNIKGGTLTPGTYIYKLVVDNVEIDTKKSVFVR